ncbi:7339_t:CDS:2 [Paraglomus occultum]|uniref:7339_t:CDS:1 n=1 Tax=Paraglomus occultum TaxID=144539 RepID=A0A9N9GU82_9GLOM|nr:7339_t:CDS:2 [Paraglomus occultum]
MCGTYLKNGSYESDVPKNFQTTQGKGEDDDLNVEEEEYCSICEKLIGKDDKTRVFVGTDYVACSDACYSKGEFLSEDERDKFKGIILKGLSEDQFKGVVLQVQNLIQTRRGNEDDENNDVLQSQIQKTINEIDFELNKSPKINEEEIDFDLVSWRNYLLGSVDLNQLASRREEILSVVKKIRQQKKKKKQGSELDQVRKEAIQKIREELTKSPPIESEELKIKKLRSSDVYQEEKTKVQDIEKQLQKLNPEKYKEVVELILDQQLENNRLNDSNIDEETKQAIAAAKINPSQENLDKAEEAICQKGADNELTELFEKVETRIKQGNLTKEEREVLIDEIYEFAKKNNYREIACEKKQQAMDVLLDKLLD